MDMITIENLINEGEQILNGIKYIPPPPNVLRGYKVYQLTDDRIYESWKNIVIRYLSVNYANDVSIAGFRNAISEFERKHYSPSFMKKMLGILEAYKTIPISTVEKSDSQNKASIVINNTNSQTQNQTQSCDMIIKSIEEAFTVSQLKELKQIVNAQNGDLEKAKPKLIEKIKSFGADMAPSIVANILTNPSIWAVFGM
ncbi:MAG: peptide chain release factor 1 [Prevotella sp.]|nr:peptide chain release factor 1 [Prevotella sp.]